MVVAPTLMRMLGTELGDDAGIDGWFCVLILKSGDWKRKIVFS